MNFRRMGRVDVSKMVLRPACDLEVDDSFLPFEIMNLGILNRAHFYDDVKEAYILIYSTYAVTIKCTMQSGYKTQMAGECTPAEFQILKHMEERRNDCAVG